MDRLAGPGTFDFSKVSESSHDRFVYSIQINPKLVSAFHELRDRAHTDDTTLVNDGHAITGELDLGEQMGVNKDRDAPAREHPNEIANLARPTGSSAEVGSSSRSTSGWCSIAWAMPIRWVMPLEYPCKRSDPRPESPTSPRTMGIRSRRRSASSPASRPWSCSTSIPVSQP